MSTSARHPSLLSYRLQIALLLRETADRFDERSLTALASLLRKASMELDDAEQFREQVQGVHWEDDTLMMSN